jgi:hypothetical protein
MPRSQDQPVLVYEATHGTGKTALADCLAEICDQVVPFARINFEANRQATVPEVLSGLAFELSQRCADYIELKFTRLLTGLVVMRESLDLDNHKKARAQVTSVLEVQRNIDTLQRILGDVAKSLSHIVVRDPNVQVDPLVSEVPGAVLKWLAKRRRTRSIVLGSVHEWYGHRGRGFPNDAIDKLIDLNRWARDVQAAQDNDDDDEDARKHIDRLLLDAFLADLRAEFANARRADELSANCVVVLDNADTALSQYFLGELVDARQLRVAERKLDPEPLTVVATSRGELLASALPGDVLESDGDPAETGKHLWQAHGKRSGWLRYRLPDLTRNEVGSMVEGLALTQGDDRRLTTMMYQMTGGHPAATQLLLKAVADWPDDCDALARVLTRPEPARTTPRLPVAARMLAGLLGDFPESTKADLVTSAAAHTRDHAVRLADSDDQLSDGNPLLAGTDARYREIIDPVLWPASEGAGPALLRRLLLGELAERRTAAQPGAGRHDTPGRLPEWTEVFGWHRARCANASDHPSELYYALANGDLAYVAPILLSRLAETPAVPWRELLRFVIIAPYRAHYVAVSGHTPIEDHAPIEELDKLTGNTRMLDRALAAMSRLIAAEQILASPLTDARRRPLHLQVADDYGDLAKIPPSGRESLTEAAREHRRQAEFWKN